MAYDEKLFKKLEVIAAKRKDIFQMKMFGGVGYLLKGNMCFGVYQNYLILWLGPDQAAKALLKKHTKHFDITGRPMKGWVMVEDKGLKTRQSLNQWVDLAVDFVAKMPRK
jgi:TfoX/Sxy family transcriptional regulator of competence genes